MAATITAKPNQSMQDIVLMACGTLDGAMAFCHANRVSISDVPVAGHAYTIPDGIAFDEEVLTDLAQRSIVIGTLNPDPAPALPFRIILYPPMEATMIFPGTSGGYELLLSGTSDFVNFNPLPTTWPCPNHLKNEHKSFYEADVGTSAADIAPYTTLQSNKETRYFVGAGISTSPYLWWSDTSDFDNLTAVYEDIAGWRARCAPLVLYQAGGSPVINTLNGTLNISVDSVVGATVYLSIAMGNTPITIADFNLVAQSLVYKPAGGILWTAVPTVHPYGDTVVLPFTPGLYELLLKSSYASDDLSVYWPGSYITMVFEIL